MHTRAESSRSRACGEVWRENTSRARRAVSRRRGSSSSEKNVSLSSGVRAIRTRREVARISRRRAAEGKGSRDRVADHSLAEEVADVHEAPASLEHARLLRGFLRAKHGMRHRPGSVLASVQLAEHRARHAVGLVRAANPRVAIRPARRRAPPRRPAIGVAERARGRPAPGGGEREAPSTPSDSRRGVARPGARPRVAGAARAIHAGGNRRAERGGHRRRHRRDAACRAVAAASHEVRRAIRSTGSRYSPCQHRHEGE